MRLKRLISDKSGNTIFSRRFWKFLKQRMKYGFDQSDTWSLDYTVSKFILPRLKMFRDITSTYPAKLKTIEEWNDILDKMIIAFDYMIRYDDNENGFVEEMKNKAKELTKALTPEQIKEYKTPWSNPSHKDIVHWIEYYDYTVKEGLSLFAKYYRNLWW